jgi:hypothetical protein
LLNQDSKAANDNVLEIVQAQLSDLKKLVEQLVKNPLRIDDWITEIEAIQVSGLSRATLFKLRKEGTISSSTLSGKQNFYRLSDFKKLLELNERKR